MIMDFEHTWETYEEILGNYDLSRYECPQCGKKSNFIRHGSYWRHLLVCEENNGELLNKSHGIIEKYLKILRVRCKNCRSTHAVLTGDMVAGKVYSYPCIIMLLSCFFEHGQSVLGIKAAYDVDYQTVYRFIAVFLFYKSICEKFNSEQMYDSISFLKTIRMIDFRKKFFQAFKIPLFASLKVNHTGCA